VMCIACMSIRNNDTCRDVEHKKRGRPKLADKTLGAWGPLKDLSVPLSTDTTKAASLAKTRVKGKYISDSLSTDSTKAVSLAKPRAKVKYTKLANYKMPKKVNTHTSSDHISIRPPTRKELLLPTGQADAEAAHQPYGSSGDVVPHHEFICARVSDESQALWGYHPRDISHKALHSTVFCQRGPSQVGRLLRMIKDAAFYAASPNAP
ncbi:hypothetical protein BGZ52_010515, partial [Haplosporangium bisporale]